MLHDQLDADYLQSELERIGSIASCLKKQGICLHGWRQGRPGSAIPQSDDVETCLHCDKTAPRKVLDAERDLYL